MVRKVVGFSPKRFYRNSMWCCNIKRMLSRRKITCNVTLRRGTLSSQRGQNNEWHHDVEWIDVVTRQTIWQSHHVKMLMSWRKPYILNLLQFILIWSRVNFRSSVSLYKTRECLFIILFVYIVRICLLNGLNYDYFERSCSNNECDTL